MSKRVAIIHPLGFYAGGTIALCVQYAKLGLDVYIRDYVSPNSCAGKPDLPNNITLYNSSDELENVICNYDRIIIVELWYGTEMQGDVLDDLVRFREHYPNLEICWIYCARTLKACKEVIPVLDRKHFKFTHVFTLNSEVNNYKYLLGDGMTLMRLNAYTPIESDIVDVSERTNIVFSAGRVEAFKGVTRYIGSIDESFIENAGDFIFEHNGATFNFHKTDAGVSCPPQLLSVFDMTKSPKQLKPYYVFKDYSESETSHKFNIYPIYRLDDILEKWKHNFAGVCCILGSKHGYIKYSNLLGSDIRAVDKTEHTRLLNSAKQWNADLEYADLEKLNLGIPVLFSRMYASIIGFTDERLIYDSFSEIPFKINALMCYYNDIVHEQQIWYKNNISQVNDDIVRIFGEEFK